MKKNSKIIIKDYILLISFVVFVGIFIALSVDSYNKDSLLSSFFEMIFSLTNLLNFSFLSFIFFSIWSFEVFFKIKNDNVDETLGATKKGTSFFYINMLKFVLLCVLVFSAIVFLTQTLIYFIAGLNYTDYLIYIYKSVFIYFSLTSVFGVVFGLMCATVFGRISAYSIMVLFFFLASPFFDNVVYMLYDGNVINLYFLSDLFGMFVPGTNWTHSGQILFPVGSYLIYKLLFWVAIMLLFIFIKQRKKTKHSKTVVPLLAVLSICLCIMYYQPTSKGMIGGGENRHNDADGEYRYKWEKMYENPEIEDVGFSATKYELDFSIKRQLEASVRVYVDNGGLNEYMFMLYNGYKLKSVYDNNNNKLDFEQRGDWFSVFPFSTQNIEYLDIKYSGYSSTFVSNSDSIILPAGFAYYPISGRKHVFMDFPVQANRLLLDNSVPVSLKISGPKKEVFTNLEKTSEGEYVGTTNGLTLMSGFLKSTIIDDIEIIYSPLEANSLENEEFLRETRKNITSIKNMHLTLFPKNDEITKIFFPPSLVCRFFSPAYVSDGHLVSNNIFVNLPIEFYASTEKNHIFRSIGEWILDSENKDKSMRELILPDGKVYDPAWMSEYDILLIEKAEEFGDDYVREKVMEYFYDNSITQTFEEYLASLDGK